MKTYLDVETCGFYGMPVTLQYAFDNGPIQIHDFWTNPVSESLALIHKIAQTTVVGFNLAFDWFHLCKAETTFSQFEDDFVPYDDIDRVAYAEERARDGKCLKPFKALDIMLHAKKTEFQMTMERSDIRIRKVPTELAWSLAEVLENNVKFSDILFERRKNKLAPKWTVYDIKDAGGKIRTDFKDVVLKFKASAGLKALAIHALKIPVSEILQFTDVEVNKNVYPKELGYAPYALAIGRRGKWKKTWPEVINHHIHHWQFNGLARKYALLDVDYVRRLDEYFSYPEPGDDDSELACAIAAVRWRGYAVDIPGIKELKVKAEKRIKEVPTAPRKVKTYISQVLSEEEIAAFTSTGKVHLEKMASYVNGEPCPFGKCDECNNTGMLPAPASAQRAADVLEARKMLKEIELYNKLLVSGRLHASFKIIGALSTRMAGADGLNAQGIKRVTEVRAKFPLAFGKLRLRGGDFAGFEVVLADAVYHDPLLRRDLLTCEKCRDTQVIYTAGKKKCPKCGGKTTMKIHALFGIHVYPDMDYDQIKATDGTADDRYNKSKSAVFAMIYGGEGYTLMTRLGVPIEVANEAYQKFTDRYVGVKEARNRIIRAFASMKQERGIGSAISFEEPEEAVSSLLGFKRYFTLENMVVKELFALAQNPPPEWAELKIKVRRRDRDQYASGAVQSALYGAAFQIQSANVRAAANHEIQSSGAGITKHVQRKIWDIQPYGSHDWLVQPCNIHDEILCPTDPSVEDLVRKTVHNAVESFRDIVPLIEFEWKEMSTWANKK